MKSEKDCLAEIAKWKGRQIVLENMMEQLQELAEEMQIGISPEIILGGLQCAIDNGLHKARIEIAKVRGE